MTRTILAALALVLSLAASAPALAQQQPPASAEDDDARARAEPLFAEGVRFVGEQRWAEALDAFQRARAIYDAPIVVFNIGYCQRALGLHVDALATFRAFLTRPLEGVALTRRAEAEDYARELEARIARVTVEVVPELATGTEVLFNGRPVELDAEGRHTRLVSPGPQTIVVRHEGYVPLFLDRNIAPGATEVVRAELRRLPARLVISSNVAQAEVRLDGEAIGRVPYDAEAEPGRRRIEVRGEGYVPHRSTVDLLPGATARVSADLELAPVPITSRWWFWGAIGAAAIGVAVTTFVVVYEPDPPPLDGGNIGWVVDASP